MVHCGKSSISKAFPTSAGTMGRKEIGVVAEDVDQVVPELVAREHRRTRLKGSTTRD
jgi:hypothetical protein